MTKIKLIAEGKAGETNGIVLAQLVVSLPMSLDSMMWVGMSGSVVLIGFTTQTRSDDRPICLPTKVAISKNDVFYEVAPGMILKIVAYELLFA